MSSESPASILFSTDGYELAVQGGVATPAGTRALLVAGSDGSTTRIMLTDGYSRQVVVGAGTAGGPTGGVLSIQGVTSGTAVTVAQSTQANLNATVYQSTASNLNAAVVGTGTAGTPTGGLLTIQGATGAYPVLVSQATASNLNAAVVGTGTAGTPTGGVLTIQGATGSYPVLVSQATASNLNAAVVGTGTAGTPTGGVLTVQGATGGYAIPVSSTPIKSTSPSTTSVASSASNVMLLALNSNRLGASIFNDSSAIVYIKLGVTASLTSYAIKLYPNSYWEVPSNYVGQIDAIWAYANGNARITELD